MATPEQIAAAKRYARIEHDEDDDFVEELWDTAVEYLRSANVVDGPNNHSRFRLAVKAMVAYWYDHREEVGNVENMPARSIVNQMKLDAIG